MLKKEEAIFIVLGLILLPKKENIIDKKIRVLHAEYIYIYIFFSYSGGT